MLAEQHRQGVSLSEAWRVERRVIWALVLREMMTRYGRHNIGFLWVFCEPMLFTLGVTALWTATRSFHGTNLPIVAFAITGYSSVLLWRNMPGRCIGALETKHTLL
jgi:ABC-2 type transport system permease protein/capsular polysaccharide transport system permease protein